MIRRVKYSNNMLISNKLSHLVGLKPKLNSLFIEISSYLKRDHTRFQTANDFCPSIIL